MKNWTNVTLIFAAILLLAACGRDDPTPAEEDSEPVASVSQESDSGNTAQQRDSVLANDFEGALPPMNQLVLGILLLEETENAITGAQAASMLVLWQALQSGTIQNQTERAAILTQIEGTLTDAQIEEIRAMQLTFTDMNQWAQENGIELPQFGQGRGQGAQGGRGGQGGIFADMSEDERAAFRQEMQSLSPEERQERLREMGVEIPEGGFQGQGGGGGPGGAGRFGFIMAPLIELLESKAAY